MTTFNIWDTEITYLKGVGPKRAEVLLNDCEIRTFGDLLHYFPRKYVDRSKVLKIREIGSGAKSVSLVGKLGPFAVVSSKNVKRLTSTFYDGTGVVELVWFRGINWIKDKYKPGTEVALFGQPKFYNGQMTIAHPEIDVLSDDREVINNLKIVPYYSSTDKLKRQGLDSKGFRTLIYNLLEIAEREIVEVLSPELRRRYKLGDRHTCIREIHFPGSYERLNHARYRLIFEEFFFFQLLLTERRLLKQPTMQSHPFPVVGKYFNTFYHEYLPFQLTNAQKRVMKEIRRDLGRPYQMNRLVQGDVGCGKTMVAFMACLIALDNGFQAGVMAPTEILADQHYRSFKTYGDHLGIEIGLIVGGQRKKARTELLRRLKEGEIDILIGTHAIIEDPVEFKNLGLSIVDEQHKFGVEQRAKLWKKGEKYPHNMVMTATPIPRTLGMTLYGDLDVSVIDELPPGRMPIQTFVVTEGRRLEMFGAVRRELDKGHQAYIVYPLVEESAKLDYLAVTEGYEAIQKVFPNYRVGIVHGKQKAADKDFEMQRFKKGEFQILVSTTVIEVGVDVPNATIMVIENSERFGLSQLHQLRGRIGRGGNQSYCVLMMGPKPSYVGKQRLKAMVDTQDGFQISEIDLKLRGPGDFLGTRQSGLPEFRVANIVEDGHILNLAKEAATALIAEDPHLQKPENQALHNYFKYYLRANSRLLGIARSSLS